MKKTREHNVLKYWKLERRDERDMDWICKAGQNTLPRRDLSQENRYRTEKRIKLAAQRGRIERKELHPDFRS